MRTAWAAMMRGEVDFLYEVGPEAVEFMKDETTVKIFPFSARLRLRRDRKFQPAEVFRLANSPGAELRGESNGDRGASAQGAWSASAGPAWPHHWAFDSTVPNMTYDPSRAAALLDEAAIANSAQQDRSTGTTSFHMPFARELRAVGTHRADGSTRFCRGRR